MSDPAGLDPDRDWLFWDGACGFCARCAGWVRDRDTTGRFRIVPWQEAPAPPLTRALHAEARRAVLVLTADGSARGGGRAVLHVLERLDRARRRRRAGVWRALSARPWIWCVELGYRTVAALRRGLRGEGPGCDARGDPRGGGRAGS